MKRLTRAVLFSDESRDHGLAGKSARGGIVSILQQGILLLLRVAGIAVLARLLTPEDYGLVGMVLVIVGFATMLKDAGLSTATVQQPTITVAQVTALFWINVMISVVMGLLLLAASPSIARFYGRPELTAVTAALSAAFIVSGLSIQHRALLTRHMRFGSLAVIRIGAQVAALAGAITLAGLGFRYWALVANALIYAFVDTGLTLAFCPWRPGRPARAAAVGNLLRFGGNVTAADIVNHVARNLDNILIGKFISADALGLYAKAYEIFMLPIRNIRIPIVNVGMPVLCALAAQPERYRMYYGRLLDILASLTVPLAVYCALEADVLIRLLLGEPWLGAVPVFRILAVLGLVQAVSSTSGLVMLSCGLSRRFLILSAVQSFGIVAAFAIGLPYGIKGVAAAYVTAGYLLLFPTLILSYRATPATLSLFLSAMAWPIGSAALAALAAVLTRRAAAPSGFLDPLLFLLVFAAVYAAGCWSRPSFRATTRMFLAKATSP